MKQHLNSIIGFGIGLCLSLALLVTAVEAVVYWIPGYFEYEYEKHQVLDNVDMEMDALLNVTDHMMKYLRGQEDSLQIYTVIHGNSPVPFFNQREILHMVDVKNLFLGGLAVRRICLIMIAAGVFILWKRKALSSIPKAVCMGTAAAIVMVCGLSLLVSTDFTRWFTKFHHIFFDNDLWILNPATDRLINIVPEEFFMDTAAAIALVFIIFITVVLAASFILGKITKK